MAKAFGEQNPTQGEEAVSWQTWSNGAGAIPEVTGNADWGKLKLELSGEEGRSAVYDLGSAHDRKYILTENRYGTGAESATLQIRGDTSTFNQDDLSPVWQTYTTPMTAGWRYVQIRAITRDYAGETINLFVTDLIAYWPLWEPSGSTVNDISGNGRNGSYTSCTLAQAGIQDGKTSVLFDGATSYASVYSTALRDAFNGAEGTLNMWLKNSEAAGTDIAYHDAFRLQVDTSNRIYIQKDATNSDSFVFAYKAGGVNCFGSFSQIATKWAGFTLFTLTWSASNSRVRCYINGVQEGTDVTTLGTWAGTITSAIIGAASATPTTPWSGNIAHVSLVNRELSAPEILALYDDVPHGYLVFEGDSRTSGSGATTATAYPPACARKLTYNWKCFNNGGTGATVQNMIDEIATTLIVPAGNWRKKVAILWGSVNASTDAATMHSKIVTWCQLAKAAGYQVIICTEVDAQDAARLASGWHATEYQALNVLIRNNYTAYADGIADLGNNANLQDATNTTYFDADKLHLNATGYLVVAGIVAAAVNAL